MKIYNELLESVLIEVKLKNGTVIRTESPETLILSYQNFDVEEAQKGEGKFESNPDLGGIQIVGKPENVKFALFTLLAQISQLVPTTELIGIFSKIVGMKADDLKAEIDLKKAAADKSKPRN